MRYREIIEGVRRFEVFHFTSAEGLRSILDQDCIRSGASTHDLGDTTLHGVSTTRNPFFNILNTYAIAGRKPWRIGLDYTALRHNKRVLPVRDDYLRAIARQTRIKTPFGGSVSSDEMEEFVIGNIEPLSRYITSITVEESAVDFLLHPNDHTKDPDYYEAEFDLELPDQQLLFDILAHTHPREFAILSKSARHGTYHANHIGDVNCPLFVMDREDRKIVPFETKLAWALQ